MNNIIHNRPHLTVDLDNGIHISAIDHTYEGRWSTDHTCETCVFYPDEWGMNSDVVGDYDEFVAIATHYHGMSLASFERYNDQWAPYYTPRNTWPAPDPAQRRIFAPR